MFKKLRNRLLFVNMLIISALLLGCFAVTYVITHQNIQRTTSAALHQIIEFDRRIRLEPPRDKDNRPAPLPENGRPAMPGRRADMMAQFVIRVNEAGEVVEVHTPFEIDFDSEGIDFKEMLQNPQGTGVIGYSGGYWAYLAQKTYDGYKIAFVDYTSEHQILFNLLIILALVWVAALAAAFIISLSSANKSIAPVEDSYNRQKQFVADASHELKTPLTTINANIDVLMDNSDMTDEGRKWLGYIKSETERMTKLTNDLLCLARLDHTGESSIKSEAAISECVENAMLTTEAVAFEKSINLECEIEPDITVRAPQEQVKQVIMILLDNAVKYTPENGTINMSLARDKSEAVLKIRNSGEGISEADMEHIFDRFYRADKSRARESGGYGLGLAIAKSICEGCGGKIEVESQTGEFTEFTARFVLA